MYGRNVEGNSLTLEASGRLYRDALVLTDRETETLWIQEIGQAVRGPLQGQSLQLLPGAVTTTWARWRRLHPDTLALRKPPGMEQQQDSVYANYFADLERIGIFGSKLEDQRLAPKEQVLGLHIQGQSRAYPCSALRKVPLLEDSLAGVQILVAHSAKLDSVVLYRAPQTTRPAVRAGDQLQSGAQAWDLPTGKLVSGEGLDLEPLPAVRSFWYAWARFHPETTLGGTSPDDDRQ